jgi:hypothetical protein
VGHGIVNPDRAVSAVLGGGTNATAPAGSGLGPAGTGRRGTSGVAAIWTAFGAAVLAALVWAGLLVQRAHRRPPGARLGPASAVRRHGGDKGPVKRELRARGHPVR